jgi:hypothetical protein
MNAVKEEIDDNDDDNDNEYKDVCKWGERIIEITRTREIGNQQ